MCKAMEELYAEGKEEGRAEGMEQGKLEQAKAMAQKLLRKGDSLEEIADLVGYSVSTVKKWFNPTAE